MSICINGSVESVLAVVVNIPIDVLPKSRAVAPTEEITILAVIPRMAMKNNHLAWFVISTIRALLVITCFIMEEENK